MKIGIIADDLTGANATGVRLAKEGFKSATIVLGGTIPINGGFTSISVDTDSRYCSPKEAQNRVRLAFEQLSAWGAGIIGKRIDSTVRGNIGVEVDILLDVIGKDGAAIVVPSYPDSGRVLSGGYLLVDGVPVQETDVAKDPMNPIKESHIPTLLTHQSRYKVAHIGLGIVLKGKESIEKELLGCFDAGYRNIVIDAVTNEEIDTIADAMVSIKGRVLIPVDPGPLSAAYARMIDQQHKHKKKWVVTVGSVTSLSAHQIRYLIDKTNSHPIYVDAKALASLTGSWNKEIERASKEALNQIKKQDILIITTYNPNSSTLNLSDIAKSEGTREDKLAKRITEGLAQISKCIVKQTDVPIEGIFSCGGDVTAAICAVTEAKAISLEDEVIPLAAYGRFIGGTMDGIPVVTKGGMVGDKKSIHTCVKYLMTKKLKEVEYI